MKKRFRHRCEHCVLVAQGTHDVYLHVEPGQKASLVAKGDNSRLSLSARFDVPSGSDPVFGPGVAALAAAGLR